MPKKRIIININEAIEEIISHELWELHYFFPELLKLKKEGVRIGYYFFIRCPFHKDKTPSFNWSIRGHAFHCYGCGASGNMIEFFSRKKKISFFKSVIILAKFFKVRLIWERVDEYSNLPFTYYLPDEKKRLEELKRKQESERFHFKIDNSTDLPF